MREITTAYVLGVMSGVLLCKWAIKYVKDFRKNKNARF